MVFDVLLFGLVSGWFVGLGLWLVGGCFGWFGFAFVVGVLVSS